MEKLLTVIIPAYNVSDYIDECLGSLLSNSDINGYLEIIAVNDGSTDNTLEKMLAFEQKYPDVVKVIDKENGGHGSGINKGIELAVGRYLKVLDSDDWVNSEGLTMLVSTINSLVSKPDIIINPYEYVWQTDGHIDLVEYSNLETNKIITLEDLNRFSYSFSLHSLTIRTDIYKNSSIPKIDEKISYDDIEYILYPVPYITTVYYLNQVVYEYRYGMDSQSVSMHNYIKRREQHKKVISSLVDYYNSNKNIFSDVQKHYYINRLLGMINHNVNLICALEDKKEGKKEMQEFLKACEGIDLRLIDNKKLQFLLKTGCNGYAFVNWYYNKFRR